MELAISLCFMFALHFLGDFILQSNDMALNKSTSNKWLFYHIIVYSMPLWLMFFVFSDLGLTALFVLLNAILHAATDYVSSRVASYYWKKDNRHNFFVTIGADQLIHTMSLVVTFMWIMN